MKLVTKNKKAFFDYEVLESIEAGIVLTGDEVKAIRAGHISLAGSFATIHAGELSLLNTHISSYSHAYQKDESLEKRSRKLLLHKKELNRLIGDISRKGITLVPLKIYFNDRGRLKVELGLCKHKKAASKKKALKERDIRKETARELKDVYKYS